VGDGADNWGPVVRETRERRPARKARSKREDVFPVKTRPTPGMDGPAGRFRPAGQKGVVGVPRLRGRMGRLAVGPIGPKVKEKFFSE
jgi:hypothetical protein